MPQPVSLLEFPNKLRDLVDQERNRPAFTGVTRMQAGDLLDERWPAHFAAAGQPVLVSGYLAGTPLNGVTFADVRARAGAFALDPSQKPPLIVHNYGAWVDSSKPMRLEEYIDAVLSNGEFDPKLYQRYRNIRISPPFRQALGLIKPGFLTNDEVNPPCIWMGRAGSCTGLHTDPNDNFVLGVIGAKRFHLFSPADLPNLYLQSVGQSSFLRSPVDPRRPDIDTYPLVAHTHCVTAELGAGDLLFLPLGWPHFVECLAHAFTYNYWLRPQELPYFKRRVGTRLEPSS